MSKPRPKGEIESLVVGVLEQAQRRIHKVLLPWLEGSPPLVYTMARSPNNDIMAFIMDRRGGSQMALVVGQFRVRRSGLPNLSTGEVEIEVETEIRDEADIQADLSERYGRAPTSPLEDALKPVMVTRA